MDRAIGESDSLRFFYQNEQDRDQGQFAEDASHVSRASVAREGVPHSEKGSTGAGPPRKLNVSKYTASVRR